MRCKVLLDCDGLLADFTGEALRRINKKLGTTFSPEHVTQWDAAEALGIDKKLFWDTVKEPGFCRSLPVLPCAREAVAQLKEIADVTVATSPMHSSTWHWERVEWLHDFGIPHHDIIFAHDKTHVHGDILIDDKLSTIEAWTNKFTSSGGLLWDAPYNQTSSLPINALRVRSWTEVLTSIMQKGRSCATTRR